MTSFIKRDRASQLQIEYLDPIKLVTDPRNARQHSKGQLVRLQAAVQEFGFTAPIIIDEHNQVVAGHARLAVAKTMGMAGVPCVRVGHLTAIQKRALAIADNKIAELAEWDFDVLRHEFASLCELEFPVELTGFDTADIDLILEFGVRGSGSGADPADTVQPINDPTPPTTLPGDCWLLGNHRLVCANALQSEPYELLLGERRAAMVITDPPNAPIHGQASGLGNVSDGALQVASGQMSPPECSGILRCSMERMAQFSNDGSLHFIFADWREIAETTSAGAQAYSELMALCVWTNRSGGKDRLYRSQHGLVFVFKNGSAPHKNNIQIGKRGRRRSNVWDYASVTGLGSIRDEGRANAPTLKPVAMIADAILDCSKRGDIILDPFAGSGTIILAAERTGRKAAAIELEPHYVDTAVRRWQQATGSCGTLLASGETFDETVARRAMTPKSTSAAPTSGGVLR